MCNVICSRNVLSSKKKIPVQPTCLYFRLPGHSVVKRQWCRHYNLGAPGALWEHILYRWINAHIPCHSQQHESFNWVYYHHWGLRTHLTHCGLEKWLVCWGLTVSSHYLHRCWVLIDLSLSDPSGSKFTTSAQSTLLFNGSRIILIKSLPYLSGAIELNIHFIYSNSATTSRKSPIIWWRIRRYINPLPIVST